MSPPFPEVNFSVVWSDEFNGPHGSLPDSNKWEFIVSGPNFGNNEVQNYTSSTHNVSLSGSGSLQITPQKDAQGVWTSARLHGKHSYACPPGRISLLQASLRLGTAPSAEQAGIWPALWALGSSFSKPSSDPQHKAWPECGEWDIVENAHGVDWTLASLHYGPANRGPEISRGGNPNTSAKKMFDNAKFHTFALKVNRSNSDWRKEDLEWFVDGERWFTVSGADVGDATLWANVAHQPFFPILNVAVGSNFPAVGGHPDTNTVSGLGSGMEVKYVAFYQSDFVGNPPEEKKEL